MKWEREKSWYKTYDYKSGHTYILAEKFSGKTAAMKFAESCGMAVIPQSTVPITDDQREIAILKNEIKEMKETKKTK